MLAADRMQRSRRKESIKMDKAEQDDIITEYDKPANGKNYVIVTLKIENKSNSKISYNTYDWKMVNSQGQEDDETFATINNGTSLNSGDLTANGTKTGTLIYEEPKNETSLKLLYYSNSLFDENSTFEIIIK